MRCVVAAFGAGLLLGGVVMLLAGLAAGIPVGVVGALVLVGTLGERFRYKRLDGASPGLGWRRTDERFVDAESGDVVIVHYRESSGERRYVRGAR